MAKITVRLHGQEISSVELADGAEYIAGRAEDCQIVLPNQKGISRHHLKFYQRDSVWVVELLARYGQLMQAGQTHEVLELKEDCGFSAPPFEFSFTVPAPQADAPAGDEAVEVDDKSTLMPAVRTSLTAPQTKSQQSAGAEAPDPVGNSEATAVGVSTIMPFLRITSKSSPREEILKLEGHIWVAGRDTSCEIHLDEGRASRRHFELSRTHEGFFITDLDSANGTYLNEEQLSPNEPWQLASGDTIRVAGVKLVFEIRDLGFSSRVPATVPQALEPADMQVEQQFNNMPMPYFDPGAGYGANVVKVEPPSSFWNRMKQGGLLENKPRLILMILVPVLLIKLFSGGPAPTGPQDPNTAENNSTSPSFDQLSAEQQRAVKDSFNLAKTMYMQGKYSLCLAELGKLHQIVPAFDNSSELQTFCRTGHDLAIKQQDNERKEREKLEAARFISQVVADCKRTMNKSTTIEEIRECLAAAIERDPENGQVLELQSQVQINQSERERKRQNVEAAANRKAAGQRLFEKAKGLYKSGELAKALAEYEKFLDGSYGLETQESEAKRDVAQARKELDQKVAALIGECKDSLEKSQYKAAYLACDKILKENPGNGDAKRLRAQALSEMRRELKSIYEDSVLEESMGNIDTAKERWKQIMEKSVPGDEYHNKSKRNLQKYGVGS